jgi:DNA-binding response OmpR family regulator
MAGATMRPIPNTGKKEVSVIQTDTGNGAQTDRQGAEARDGRAAPRLIVIDDELSMAALIAEVAEIVGFETSIVDSVRQFLQSRAEQEFDVIAIDLFMPETDGFELIDILAKQGCKAAIIMVSGYDKTLLNGSSKMAEANGLNLQGIFTKPFQLDEVEALLRKIYQQLDKSAGPGSLPTSR